MVGLGLSETDAKKTKSFNVVVLGSGQAYSSTNARSGALKHPLNPQQTLLPDPIVARDSVHGTSFCCTVDGYEIKL